MDDLIKALQILRKYGNPDHPTHCEHDVLVVYGISPDEVSEEDKNELEKLGFLNGNRHGDLCFYSFRYGSC